MTIVGIDYSMNSIGVCTFDGKTHKFYALINTYSLTSSIKEEVHKNFYKNCNSETKDMLNSLDDFVLFTRNPNSVNKKVNKSEKNNELNRWHRNTLEESNNLSENVMSLLFDLDVIKNDTIFVIENYLTNRNGGDTTIQIIEFTKSFKDKLYNQANLENIFIVTAPEIKMLAGSGNYNKQNMLNSFVGEKIESPFIDFCKLNKTKLYKGTKDTKKPIDDVVDSYFLIKWYTEKLRKTSQSMF